LAWRVSRFTPRPHLTLKGLSPVDTAVTLLLVDDEVLIVELLKDALEDGGFTVLVAHSAEEAMALVEERATEIAGLVTDVNLGSKVTGWVIARRARELSPSLPVVYTSGFAADDWPAEGVPHSLVVRKPFAPAQVVTAISSLINKAASQPSGSPSGA